MIDSVKIRELIKKSSNVYITGHKNIDLDALGSMLGMYYVVKNEGKDAKIIIDDLEYTPEVRRALSTIKKSDNIVSVNYKDIKNDINSETLLIVADTNKSNRIQNEHLNRIKNILVIDHHIETNDDIKNVSYKCINIDSSSACEMVLELIDELNVYIPSVIATIMLAGIYIDTNGFLLKTSLDTHKYTALLYNFGADNKEVQYLLKQNYNEFRRRQKITLNTEFYNNIAISCSDSKYSNSELAKACDVLLTFNNVEASFVIAKLDDNIVGISARSLGNIDVEKIMNHFNGGGHKTDAATQINACDVENVKVDLLNYIGGLDESNIY